MNNFLKNDLLPEGFKVFLPEEAEKEEFISREILDIFFKFGYLLVKTPLVEYEDKESKSTLLSKSINSFSGEYSQAAPEKTIPYETPDRNAEPKDVDVVMARLNRPAASSRLTRLLRRAAADGGLGGSPGVGVTRARRAEFENVTLH